MCDEAIEQLSQGYSIAGLAGYFRISRETIYEWMNCYQEFSDAIKVGQAARIQCYEHKLMTTQQGVGVTAAIFGLKNAAPDLWRDTIQTEKTVTHKIESLSNEQLKEIMARANLVPGNERAPVTIDHDPRPVAPAPVKLIPAAGERPRERHAVIPRLKVTGDNKSPRKVRGRD